MKTTSSGSARVTQTDIARLAGVSVTTVSRVLSGRAGEIKISEDTSARILRLADEHGYRPNLFAKALRTNQSQLIGLVVWDFADPYYGAVVVGAETALATLGYTAVLSDAGRSEDQLCRSLSRMDDFQTDGALVIGGPGDLARSAPSLVRDDPRRTVFVATRNPHMQGATVLSDNFGGARAGVDHLITRWKRPLVCLRAVEGNHDVEERVRGVEASVQAHGYESSYTERVIDLGEDGGYRACTELLAEYREPISVFAFTDLTAIGAIHAVRDRGLRVPEDVSILGFDDLPLAAHVTPPLSTIRQRRRTLGRRGAEMLIAQLARGPAEKSAEPAIEVIPTELVIRETA